MEGNGAATSDRKTQGDEGKKGGCVTVGRRERSQRRGRGGGEESDLPWPSS